MSNKAAWLTEKCGYPFKIDDAPMPKPREHQLTIRVHSIAFNPVDGAIQQTGMMMESFPCILGCDAAGEVTAVGSAVTQFEVGDRVVGCVDHNEENIGQGTFQLYCNLADALAGKVPDNVSFKDACVLPLAMCTAAVGLFEKDRLELPYPQVEPKPSGKVLLIWGGSSSVGNCGIQAAKAAGLTVATTAGAHNLEYCKSIGADYAFDHKSESVVDDVVSALKGKEFAGVFDAVIGAETYIKSAEIASQLGGKQMVATVLPAMMAYNEPLPGGVEIAYSKSRPKAFFMETIQG